MTDNVNITEGAGKVIATDDVSGVQYQVIKIAIGSDGSAALISGDTTNGIDVDVTRIIPGTSATHLGKAEDASHTDGDTGVFALTVRKDSVASTAGTDGDYAALTTDASGRLWVNVSSNPVRARTTDAIAVADQTDAIMEGSTALTPKFVIIDAASSGDNTILAAVASKKIRVISCLLVAAGTVNVRFESGASGTALTGQMNLVANTGFCLPYNPAGWFQTGTNTLLNLELSAAISVDGMLTYIEVT